MASTDEFTITITGRGGHAAQPHETVDPIVVGASIVQALQTIVSRNVDPIESAVVSVTRFHAGEAYNVIADTAEVAGTVRSLQPEVRDLVEKRIGEVAAGIAAAHGRQRPPFTTTATTRSPATIRTRPPSPPRSPARSSASPTSACDAPPLMAGEDFSYMLEQRPGAFVFIGNGDSAGLHNAPYDFNDEIIPIGCSYWARLVETAMPA